MTLTFLGGFAWNPTAEEILFYAEDDGKLVKFTVTFAALAVIARLPPKPSNIEIVAAYQNHVNAIREVAAREHLKNPQRESVIITPQQLSRS